MRRAFKAGLVLGLGAVGGYIGIAAMQDRAAVASAERMCTAVQDGMSHEQLAGLVAAGKGRLLGEEAGDRARVSAVGWNYACGCAVSFKDGKVIGAAKVICEG